LNGLLEANFPLIPQERRRAYAALAGGYPRFAADLCRFDAHIAPAGDVAPVISSVHDYLRQRLSDEQRRALDLLSLVMRLGVRGDKAAELDELARAFGLDPDGFRHALTQIHDGPGFVAEAGRYSYVTPEIVARVAFEGAWRRWGGDAGRLIARIPPDLIPGFQERVAHTGPEEVRRLVADSFRNWVAELRPEGLVDAAVTERLVALADTDPMQYLPTLRRLVEGASTGTLRAVSGEYGQSGWGPRRRLVWAAERFAQLPEFFSDAERILLRLAVDESEPGIMNNATGIWLQLFRITLSGTATPFDERLALLEARLRSEEAPVRALAVRALDSIFAYNASRMLTEPVVAGRIPPPEWRPPDRAGLRACYRRALDLGAKALRWTAPETAEGIRSVLVRHTRELLDQGFLKALQEAIAGTALADSERADLLDGLEAFLVYDAGEPHAAAAREYLDSVRAWQAVLAGSDLHARVLAIAGTRVWGPARLKEEPWRAKVTALAKDLLEDTQALLGELDWLFSEHAEAAADLGLEVGRLDVSGTVLNAVLDRALRAQRTAFALGYISGLLKQHPATAERVNEWLDRHTSEAPKRIAELAIAAGEPARAFERVITLFDQRAIPARFLMERNFISGSARLSPPQFGAIVDRLTRAVQAGDLEARQVAFEVLAFRLDHSLRGKRDPLMEDRAVRDLAWLLVEIAAGGGIGERPLWWDNILGALGHLDPARAARAAVAVLVSDDYGVRDPAQRLLGTIARHHPAQVMDALGDVALSEEHGWKFYFSNFQRLIAQLPDDVVRKWIERAGVEGARCMARHLPPPYLGEGGKPMVPPLTAWVLTTFEGDDRTFREFYAGRHSFQVYTGDIAAQHEHEATVARAFREHPLSRIRQWAEWEEQSALAEAKRERLEEAERDIP